MSENGVIVIDKNILTDDTVVLEKKDKGVLLQVGQNGGGIDLTPMLYTEERYCSFIMWTEEDISLSVSLFFYGKNEDKSEFEIRFGILPQVMTPICIDMEWLNGQTLFPESGAGALKIVCHGGRTERSSLKKAVIKTLPSHIKRTVGFSNICMTKEYPVSVELEDGKLVDELGQNKNKFWLGKVSGITELKALLQEQVKNLPSYQYPFENWSEYGGFLGKKLQPGTGFFTSVRKDGS